MPNPYVNKVQKADGTTIIDISDTTAIASDVASGKYFYTAAGEKVQGTASGAAAISIVDELDSHGGTIRHINGVSLQGDTVAADKLLYGYTAHDASGTAITGSYSPPSAGTEGTPVATKGTVSNHAVTVTPSVTNTAGVISGGTHTGTAVTVTASELVSGSETKTANGTYDVTNLAQLVVNVSGSTGKNIQVSTGRYEYNTNTYAATSHSIKVAKAGTYKCYWVMDRSTTSGTTGTQLYNGNTALGSAHTSWTNTNNTRVQQCEETLTFALNDTIKVWARSRSTSYYVGVTNFFIVEQ